MRSPLPRDFAEREWILPIGFALEPAPDPAVPPGAAAVGVLDAEDVNFEELCRDLGVGD